MAVGVDIGTHSPPTRVVPWHSSRPQVPPGTPACAPPGSVTRPCCSSSAACGSSPTPCSAAASGPLRRRRDLPVQAHVDDVDVVLLSHLHHDHADLPSLRRVGHVPVVTDPANLPWLDKHQLEAADASPDTWHALAPGVEVLLVRADHEARPMPHRPNGATGMLVRGGGVVVWFAGDTSLHPDMALLPAARRRARRPRAAAGGRLGSAAVAPGTWARSRRPTPRPAPGPATSSRSTTARCTRPGGRRRGWSGRPTPVTASSRCSRSGATPRRTCHRWAVRSSIPPERAALR